MIRAIVTFDAHRHDGASSEVMSVYKGNFMKRFAVQLCLCVLLLFALSPVAFAQASRTWVSGVGDDANPCSRTAPCKTFAGAISKTAAGGEIDALDPAGYGAVTITKAITLDGGGGQVASVLVAGTNGIVVQAGASDTVIIRNLRLNGISGTSSGGLNGIRFLTGLQLVIENCDIFGFTQNGVDVAVNQAGAAKVVVHNTNFTHIGLSAVNLANLGAGSVSASLNNVSVRGATDGVATGATGNASVSADVDHSSIVQSTGSGLHATLGSISAENSMFSANGTGVKAETGATIRLANDGIYNNFTGLKALGTISSVGNNRSAGNAVPGAPNGTVTVQ